MPKPEVFSLFNDFTFHNLFLTQHHHKQQLSHSREPALAFADLLKVFSSILSTGMYNPSTTKSNTVKYCVQARNTANLID